MDTGSPTVAQLDDRNARLYAADCAERVLPRFERLRPHDRGPRRAIEAARAYAEGNATAAELAAARAQAISSATELGWAVTDNSGWTAAWAAALAAAHAALPVDARATHSTPLCRCWGVHRDSVPSTAEAAEAAAAAAVYAGGAAERQWQAQRLAWYVNGCPPA